MKRKIMKDSVINHNEQIASNYHVEVGAPWDVSLVETSISNHMQLNHMQLMTGSNTVNDLSPTVNTISSYTNTFSSSEGAYTATINWMLKELDSNMTLATFWGEILVTDTLSGGVSATTYPLLPLTELPLISGFHGTVSNFAFAIDNGTFDVLIVSTNNQGIYINPNFGAQVENIPYEYQMVLMLDTST